MIRYRQTWRQVAPLALLLAVVFGLRRDGSAITAVDLLSGVLIAAAGAFGVRRAGVVVGADALTLIRFGRRTIPWSGIAAIEQYRSMGGRGLRIQVDGRRITLPAPIHTPYFAPDPGFDEKAATIERHWRAAGAGGGPAT